MATKERTWTTGVDSSQQELFLTITPSGRVRMIRVNPREEHFETPEFSVDRLAEPEYRRLIVRKFGTEVYDEVVSYVAKRR